MANHGVFVTQKDSAVATPSVATSGIPFVVGTAPLSTAAHAVTAGTPVLITSWDEAEDKLGYSDNWTDNTLCEFMYSHFKLFACQPVIFCPVASDGASASTVAAAMEKIELCMTTFGLIPDLICAPGWSDQATVAAAMATKAASINGMFRAKALVDVKGADVSAAVSAKKGASFTENHVVCWPMGTVGGKKFHMSTLIAGRMSATDINNDGVPCETPSNKALPIDGLLSPTGTAVQLTMSDANTLNANGIVAALNFMGKFVAWGNYCACYPTVTDIAKYSIPINRMFDYVNNVLIKTFWSYLDKPMTRRLIDTVLDSANIWLNGLVGSGYLLGARVEMRNDENPVANLMAGIVKLHVYLTPPSPMQEIDFVMEYDASYVSAAFE